MFFNANKIWFHVFWFLVFGFGFGFKRVWVFGFWILLRSNIQHAAIKKHHIFIRNVLKQMQQIFCLFLPLFTFKFYKNSEISTSQIYFQILSVIRNFTTLFFYLFEIKLVLAPSPGTAHIFWQCNRLSW